MVSWTAPDVTRIDEPFTGSERGILDGFLDWHRSTLLWKCAGLTGEQLALAPVPPSNVGLDMSFETRSDAVSSEVAVFHGPLAGDS